MVSPASPSQEGTESSTRRRSSTMSEGKILVGRFEIDLASPLQVHDHAYAEAFECMSLDTGANDHVAIVVKDRFPARQNIVGICLGNEIPGLMVLRAEDVVFWPQEKRQRYVLIFRKPGGKPLLQAHTQRREVLSEEALRRDVIRPLFITLRSMADRAIFHGNIRPDNMFQTNFDNPEVILGECASSAPGINQPALYETIERGMADPVHRGAGSSLDDVYAFGVAIAVLMRGYNPMEGKSDRFIAEDKLTRGSYTVITDGLRLSPGLSEFLRSTLNDDARQRWTVEQVGLWIDGNRSTPKQSPLPVKAQRSLDFNGKKYIRARLLANDLHDNTAEALTLIESGHLSKWVERSLGDQSMADQVNAAVSRAGAGGRAPGYEERLLCFICMVLDPTGPLRYKDMKLLPDGVGYGLAFTMMNNLPIQNFGELIRERFVWMWLNNKDNDLNADAEQAHLFDVLSKTAVRRGIMYGLERCLYELSGDIPCLSDYFKDYYVSNCDVMLSALNDMAEQHKEQKPIDRHIASYIAVHDNHDNAGLLNLYEGQDPLRRSLALLTIFQLLQKNHGSTKLENLCQWLSKDAEIVAQRFKSVNLKQDVLKAIPKEVKSGNLTKLLSLVDNPQQVKKDEHDFIQATYQYLAFSREQDTIRNELKSNPRYGFDTGHQYALIASVLIAALFILGAFMVSYSGAGVQ